MFKRKRAKVKGQQDAPNKEMEMKSQKKKMEMNNDREENKESQSPGCCTTSSHQVGCSGGVANKIIGDTSNHKITRTTVGS